MWCADGLRDERPHQATRRLETLGVLVLVAMVVACGALLVEQINTEVTLSGLTKSLNVMAAAAAFWAALVLVRRQKVKA